MSTLEKAVAALRPVLSAKQDKLPIWQATAGDGRGNVDDTDTPGHVFVRILNNAVGDAPSVQATSVFNDGPMLNDGDFCIIGFTPDRPRLLHVISKNDQRYEISPPPGVDPQHPNGIAHHGWQHGDLMPDEIHIAWEQITDLLVYSNGDLTVTVYQGTISRQGVDTQVDNQIVDLSGYQPDPGALYALLSVAVDGSIVVTAGTLRDNTVSLTLADVPDTPAGNFALAVVRLYGGQTKIERNTTIRDIYDRRWPQDVNASASNSATFFLNANEPPAWAVASTLPLYTLSQLPDGAAQQDITTAAVSGDQSLVSWRTAYPLYLSALTGGVVTLLVNAHLSVGATVVKLYFNLYAVPRDGSPTLLCTSSDSAALTGSDAAYTLTGTLSDTVIDPNSFLYIEVWANYISGAATDVIVTYDGATNARLTMPSLSGGSSVPALPDGKIFVGNSAGAATPVTMSKEATIDDTGALTIATNLYHDLGLLGDGAPYTFADYLYETSSSHAPAFAGLRARGSLASPTAVQAGDVLARFGGRGYGGGFPGASTGTIEVIATETQGVGAKGTSVAIYVTPNGSTTKTLAATINQDGYIQSEPLTASTVIYSDASKKIKSLANAAGVLTNDGAGALSWGTIPAATISLAYDNILAGNVSDVAAAVSVSEQTLLGRITGGHVAALSVSDIQTLLGLGSAAYTASTDYDAAGLAAVVQGNLNTHSGLTGTSVHGLGTASTHAATDFHAATIAAGEVTPAMLAVASAQYHVLVSTSTPFGYVESGFMLDGTSGGKTVLAVTSGKTLTLTAIDNFNLTIPASGVSALMGYANSSASGFGIGITPTVPLHIKAVTAAAVLTTVTITNGTFTGSATGWTLGAGGGTPDWFYASNTVKHLNGGGTAALQPSTPLTIVAGTAYLVKFKITSYVSGSVTPSIGGTSGTPVLANTTGTGSLEAQVIVATNTNNLKFTPTNDFEGVFDTVTVSSIAPLTATQTITDTSSGVALELRVTNTIQGNVFIGKNAGLYNTNSTYNVGIGLSALGSNTTGGSNTAIGRLALSANTTGLNNVALGDSALQFNTTGQYNFAAGSLSLYNNLSGNYNWGAGYSSLQAVTTGSYNLGIGTYAGLSTNGSNNIFIGYFAGGYATGSNELYIDNQDRTDNAGDKANAIIYGVMDAAAINQVLTVNAIIKPIQAPTASAPAYQKGAIYFDTTLNKLRVGGAAAWETITSL